MFFLLIFGLFPIIITAEECEELRRENRLLRELLVIQNQKLLDPVNLDPSASADDVSVSPTWSLSSYTSTYSTIVTLPVSTEVPLFFNGRKITSTIVDYETKETLTTTVLPTSVLVYPTTSLIDSSDTSTLTTTPLFTASSKSPQIEPSRTQPDVSEKTSKVDVIRPSPIVKRPPGLSLRRPSKTAKPRSFSISKSGSSRFGGFSSNSFRRFKRETECDNIKEEEEFEKEGSIELMSSMEN
eukprot:TRINITY_DN7101_c0_g1_i1.p1 TRINITY_DN7101_c0_g1~~TRINITY_DN7101_c0_g1_i1.p1  ORF type:complete len:241 (-),score=19.72 TRINITY_DN7101_c0_g1_i1:140-862(-)